jgi:hypothetical protein
VIELKEEELLDLPQADVEQAAPEAAVEAPADDTPRPRPRPRSKAPPRPKK